VRLKMTQVQRKSLWIILNSNKNLHVGSRV
jgi:hypothetical protein